MLRVAANCQSIPDEIPAIVRKIQETGGRYIKRVRVLRFLRFFSDLILNGSVLLSSLISFRLLTL